MQTIRKGVFETNSSSTHSMVMCQDNDYKDWKEGKLYYSEWFPYSEKVKDLKKKDSSFYTEEEAKKICELAGIDWDKEDDWGYKERTEYFMTLDEFFDTDSLECEEEKFVTKGGEVVHACYKYGYEG